MGDSILITQCLQNDFVQLIEKYDPLPNQLHVGYSEAKRLLGESVEDGPVNTVMEWAYATQEKYLEIIHIRDWHDPDEQNQKDHLSQFGVHCIKDTPGADFVFRQYMTPKREHHIIDASGLNDFIDTKLEEALLPHKGKQMRVGVMGVWTEAKILFLCYELRTRYPEFTVAVCSALTASSSREAHFISLEQIQNILGVSIFSSVGAFTQFLTGTMPEIKKKMNSRLDEGILNIDDGYSISHTDKKLMLYLFRNAKEVYLKGLDGGFSGNVVVKAKSIDTHGHIQVPTVVKIGPRDLISKERTCFERIQEVMGNNAPSIVDFAEIEDRGSIKYRYASMLEGPVRTFQQIFEETGDEREISSILEIVFEKQLKRLYDARSLEKLNLLEYYDFKPKYAGSVRKNVEAIIGTPASGDMITLVPGISISSICNFYEKDLQHLREPEGMQHFKSYVHGDLNGKNILIDSQNNVWIIDFFQTHKGHVIKDLAKMENDILYIFTKVDSEEELKEAITLSDLILDVHDLNVPQFTDMIGKFKFGQFRKTLQIIQKMRSLYPGLVESDQDPYQLFVALLRYSVHNLCFEESNIWQKKWALYTCSVLAEKIRQHLVSAHKLRIDFISEPRQYKGRIGITILPGRKDRSRNIEDDIAVIKENGITHIVSLLSESEYEEYGVKNLKDVYEQHGLNVRYFPIVDQGVPNKNDLPELVEWIDRALKQKHNVLIHCVGGLGRSGVVAASYLVLKENMQPVEAIKTVRTYRSHRTIENHLQEEFIRQL
jgi:protein-tyrosine phosphatase/nicotinamidase-related amidase